MNPTELLREAYEQLRTLRERLERAEAGAHEPIAVIGMACRFPGAPSVSALWDLLIEGRCAVGSPNPGRRPAIDGEAAALLDDLEHFDARFFGISPSEARHIDPRQRLILELAWEALESAGIPPDRLRRTACGVFVGAQNGDFELAIPADPEFLGTFSGTGTSDAVIANRVSYFLDLCGPSVAIDSACSGSLMAVHMAAQSLRSGESSLALAGGVSLIQLRRNDVVYRRTGMLSASGRCRVFDRRANGLVRGEGAGLAVLKRLRDAEADGDRIVALLRSTVTNTNGRGNGLTSPSGQAQMALLREAYHKAGLAPGDVGYVEAHATGTRLGDEIEYLALREVLAEGRPPGRPCFLGSMKSNLGHTEAAAGIAGLIKACLILQHRVIPPSLHVDEPIGSPEDGGFDLRVCRERTPWPADSGRPLVGVSSFGFGGTNVHAVLEAPEGSPRAAVQGRRSWILPLSAATPAALRALATRLLDMLRARPLDEDALGDLCVSAARRRAHLPARKAFQATDVFGLIAALEAFIKRPGAGSSVRRRRDHPRVAFVYPHVDSPPSSQASRLFVAEPAFREECERIDIAARECLGRSVIAFLRDGFGPDPEVGPFPSRCGAFAFHMGLTALWRDRGVRPDLVVAQGLGEVVGACVAGMISLEDAFRMIARRSGAGESLAGPVVRLNRSDLGPNAIPFYSASSGGAVDDPTRWRAHLVLGPVAPDAVLREAGSLSDAVFLGIGPETALLDELRVAPVPGGETRRVVPSLGQPGRLGELDAATVALYEWRVLIDWNAVYPERRPLAELPSYPWQRDRHWWDQEWPPDAARNGREATSSPSNAPPSATTSGAGDAPEGDPERGHTSDLEGQ